MARPSATFLFALALAGLAGAAEGTAPARTPEELQQLQDEIARTEAERASGEAERARTAAELEGLQAEAAASAAEVQKLERALSRAEARIADLAGRDAELTAQLDERRDRVADHLQDSALSWCESVETGRAVGEGCEHPVSLELSGDVGLAGPPTAPGRGLRVILHGQKFSAKIKQLFENTPCNRRSV